MDPETVFFEKTWEEGPPKGEFGTKKEGFNQMSKSPFNPKRLNQKIPCEREKKGRKKCFQPKNPKGVPF